MKMSIFPLLYLIVSLSISFGCKETQDEDPPMTESEADLVFQNGKVYTVNPSQIWAEAQDIHVGHAWRTCHY